MQLVHKRSVGLGQQYGLLDEMWKRYFTPEHVRLLHVFLLEDRGSKFLNIGKIVFFSFWTRQQKYSRKIDHYKILENYQLKYPDLPKPKDNCWRKVPGQALTACRVLELRSNLVFSLNNLSEKGGNFDNGFSFNPLLDLKKKTWSPLLATRDWGGHWGVLNTVIPQEKLANTEILWRKSTKYRYRTHADPSRLLKLYPSHVFVYL